MDREGGARDVAPGLLRIHAVSRATGVSPHALRIWERRYGTMASRRSAAGYRLYTGEDLERIRIIKELLDAGHAVGDVAGLSLKDLVAVRAQGRPRPEPTPTESATDVSALRRVSLHAVQEQFLVATECLDPLGAERALATAGLALEPLALVSDVIAPLLVEVGDRWRDGRFTVAQEHAASAAVRSHLSELLRAARPARSAPLYVCTTTAGEQHELGAMMAGVVLAHAGAHVVYLGPSMPAADVAFACRRSGAEGVLLSVVALDPVEARRELGRIRRALPIPVVVVVGGPATLEPVPDGVTRLTSFTQLLGLLRGVARP
jgi:DNA-binding transcriptional MerR regulator/methylmalonyl-CoA mutase cobalamin-binding subunit